MQIFRTIIWVLLLVGLLLFSVANWDPTVTVRIWQGIVVDTKIPAIVIVSFAIGFFPMWLYHRASKWRMQRKIVSLETATRTAATVPVTHHPYDEEPEGGVTVAEPEPASHPHFDENDDLTTEGDIRPADDNSNDRPPLS